MCICVFTVAGIGAAGGCSGTIAPRDYIVHPCAAAANEEAFKEREPNQTEGRKERHDRPTVS